MTAGHTPSLQVRTELRGDQGAIHALHAASFPTSAEADLIDRLRSAGRLSVSLVAALDGVIVGHVAFSPVTVAGGHRGAGLGPVAVLEAKRRQGMAGQLIEAGLKECRAAGFEFVVVLGDPAYYGRFGFEPAPQHGLRDEFGGGDAFQVVGLSPGGIPTGQGLVRYAPEFDVFR